MIREFFKVLTKYRPVFEKDKKHIVQFVFLSILTIIISIFTPALIAKIILQMMDSEFINVIYILVLLAFIQCLNLLVKILSSRVFYKLRQNFIVNLKNSLSQSILKLDIDAISKNRRGKFLQRITSDPNLIAGQLEQIKRYIILLCTNIGVVIYTIYLSPILGLIYLGSSAMILTIRAKGVIKKRNIHNLYYEEQEKNTSMWSEIFNGIHDVKSINLENEFENKTRNSFENIEELQYKADFSFDICVKATTLIEWVANALIILVSAYLIYYHNMELGIFLTVFMYRSNIFSFSDSFTDMLDSIASFNLLSNRVFEIIDLYVKPEEKTIKKYDFKGQIDIKNTDFAYDKQKILENCNMNITANSSVAIVGKSGVGKTTILKLILGMYKTDIGEILLDGINVNKLSEEALRKNISMISQQFYLFDMTIKENLAIVKQNATDEEIQNVCKKVGLHEFIMSLPEQYNTNIGEGGYFLSGGQRQRLAIARTLLLNTKIILLDEVTNSLDKESEQAIMQMINELKQNHTIVLVTHNSDLVKNFDKVYYIENKKANWKIN